MFAIGSFKAVVYRSFIFGFLRVAQSDKMAALLKRDKINEFLRCALVTIF